MNWVLWIAGGYVVTGLVVGLASFFMGNSIKQALWTFAAWPLALVFIVGMLGR